MVKIYSGSAMRASAARSRITMHPRPILLTALAIILGSAVMLSDPVFGGLAIALIFGAFASTALTMFVIPLVYLGWQRRVAARYAAR